MDWYHTLPFLDRNMRCSSADATYLFGICSLAVVMSVPSVEVSHRRFLGSDCTVISIFANRAVYPDVIS